MRNCTTIFNMSAPSLDSSSTYQLEKDQALLSGAKLLRKLGKGYMGRVYKAVTDSGAIIAIKIVPFCSENDEKISQKSYREEMEFEAMHEVRIHIQLAHDNIIQLHEAYTSQNCIVLHMEYFEGRDLWTIWSDKKSQIRQEEVMKIVKQISGALHYIHKKEISHGDIHMGNVMVNRNKDAKLIDFGNSIAGKAATLGKRKDRIELKKIEEMLLCKVHNPEHANKNVLKIWLM